MRIARAIIKRGKKYGIINENESFFPVADRLSKLIPIIEKRNLLESLFLQENAVKNGQYELIAPCKPLKIIAVGLNYRDHAEEFNSNIPDEPIIFLKPPSATIGPDQQIIIPAAANHVDFEAELVVVIGNFCKNVTHEEASKYILGYTCGNDVTERNFQKKDGQWARAKGFDTFSPFGPWIETELDPYTGLSIVGKINGEVKQSSTTKNMIWGPNELVSFVSNIMTLRPGDLIYTGTPSGVAQINNNDIVEITIEGIGSLKNKVTS